MPDPRLPSSLTWLAALVMLALVTAIVAGIAIYVETQAASHVQANMMTHGNADSGRTAIVANGCQSCHVIPGISGPTGRVGPDLTHVAQRATIAGKFVNDPETMVRWLMHPQRMSPGSGMPEQGLSEKDARNIAAFLYARR